MSTERSAIAAFPRDADAAASSGRARPATDTQKALEARGTLLGAGVGVVRVCCITFCICAATGAVVKVDIRSARSALPPTRLEPQRARLF